MLRAQGLAAALAPIERGRVLWIDLDPVAEIGGPGSLRATIDALPDEPFDAVVVGPSIREPIEAARAARQRVRDGGVIALVSPVEREGMRAAAQRAALVFDRRARIRALEEMCAALLEVGCGRIEVLEIDGARGEVVVHGRPLPDLGAGR